MKLGWDSREGKDVEDFSGQLYIVSVWGKYVSGKKRTRDLSDINTSLSV
jgi:hypothetical protein